MSSQAARAAIPVLLVLIVYIFSWVQLADSCSYHAAHSSAVMCSLPCFLFASYCCCKVLLVYWMEAMEEGGLEQYFSRFKGDRFDVMLGAQLLLYLLCAGGWFWMLSASPLPPNCAWAMGKPVAAFEFSPCKACCNCLAATGNDLRCGFDYCDQAVLTPAQRWAANGQAAYREYYAKVCRQYNTPAAIAACDADARAEGRKAAAEAEARAGGAAKADVMAAGLEAARTLAPTPAPTPPTLAPTSAPTPNAWDAVAANLAWLASIESGALRPSPICWGTGQSPTDAVLLRESGKSVKLGCSSRDEWFSCVWHNCMAELGPTEPYPNCDAGCKHVPKWMEPPVTDDSGRGIYDVFRTTQFEPDASSVQCKAMCWNAQAQTNDVGGNSVGVAGGFYNHSMATPPISAGGTSCFVLGLLGCVSLVGCFTTCFKGHAKHRPLSMAEQRAEWAAKKRKAEDSGKVMTKLEIELAGAAAGAEGGTPSKLSGSVRVVPTADDPATEHLELSMKTKHGLQRLRQKRGYDRTGDLPPHRPPADDEPSGGLSANEEWELKAMEEDHDPDAAAFADEAREWAAQRHRRFSACDVF